MVVLLTGMSGILKWFSGGKKQSPQPAIQRLQSMADLLNKKMENLQMKIDEEKAKAIELSSKNKNQAKLAIKRKMNYEGQLTSTIGQLSNIESQILALQDAAITAETFEALKDGQQQLKKNQKTLNTENVEDLMDEINESQQKGKEINAAMAQSEADDVDLDFELNQLLGEQDIDLSSVPQVPKHKIPTQDVMDELQRMMEK